ncbi:UNVERIFIED_CONTAM: hypothetical protein Slati_3706400 [Sesamum latifolium]|uniref:Uncharacterized protein n=1 Tax=Sesamum latifolium TaxID=2727402 RepID=A0AAW2U3A3_9LAMI
MFCYGILMSVTKIPLLGNREPKRQHNSFLDWEKKSNLFGEAHLVLRQKGARRKEQLKAVGESQKGKKMYEERAGFDQNSLHVGGGLVQAEDGFSQTHIPNCNNNNQSFSMEDQCNYPQNQISQQDDAYGRSFHHNGVYEFTAGEIDCIGKNRESFATEGHRRALLNDKYQALRKLLPNPTKVNEIISSCSSC